MFTTMQKVMLIVGILSINKNQVSGSENDKFLSSIATQISKDGAITADNQKKLDELMQRPGTKCSAVRFTQTVRHEKCPEQEHRIQNKFCFGQCLSRVDPLVEGTRANEFFKSCMPSETFKKVITFDKCSDGKVWTKTIAIVRSCRCKIK